VLREGGDKRKGRLRSRRRERFKRQSEKRCSKEKYMWKY
jgi:hypothetical protein